MRRFILVAIVLAVVAIAVSCDQGQETLERSSVEFCFDLEHDKTFAPEPEVLETASYRIAGDGPASEGITPFRCDAVPGEKVRINDLASGEWTFTVQALNADEDVIAEGSVTKVLMPGNNNVTVVLEQSKGLGYFALGIVWNPDDIPSSDVTVKVTLTDAFGVESVLNADVKKFLGNATVARYPLFAGDYTLSVSISSGVTKVFGAVEAVRIARYADTVGDISFLRSDGTSVVSLEVEKGFVLPFDCRVTLSPETAAMGVSLKVTCETDYKGPVDDLEWQWYRNGVLMPGSTADFIRYTVSTGVCRYDCIVKCKGKVVGSAHRTVIAY